MTAFDGARDQDISEPRPIRCRPGDVAGVAIIGMLVWLLLLVT